MAVFSLSRNKIQTLGRAFVESELFYCIRQRQEP